MSDEQKDDYKPEDDKEPGFENYDEEETGSSENSESK